MCSGAALTTTTIVPEYVGLGRSASPIMTRARSDGVAPQRPIHRRIGNQYSTDTVRMTNSVGSMRSSVVCSRRDAARAAIAPLGKEIGELVTDAFRLAEHEVPSRFEADEPRAGDALGCALTRLMRGDLVVFGVDDQ